MNILERLLLAIGSREAIPPAEKCPATKRPENHRLRYSVVMKKPTLQPINLSRVILVIVSVSVIHCGVSPVNADDGPSAPPPAHVGPAVPEGRSGPQRFVTPLLDLFDRDRALEHIAFVDRFYREPGNEGFEAVVDRVIETLKEKGFGRSPTRTLEVIETRQTDGWSPVSARLSVIDETGQVSSLLAFDQEDDRNRTMLPTGAPSGKAEGRVVFSLDEVEAGTMLITGDTLGRITRRAQAAGAVAILSARIAGFNRDPSGAERHLDAIRYGRVRSKSKILVGQISLRVYEDLRQRAKNGPVKLRFEAECREVPRKLRTVVATIVGTEEPNRVIPIAGHIQEPGAVDNASGVGGLLEAAIAAVTAIEQKKIEHPKRSIAFIWGNEMEQSRVYIEHSKRTPIAAISADMIGASRSQTGAWPLLERDPDPGAIVVLAPDAHTPWGAGRVSASQLRPNGLSIIARTAFRDVARAVGGWQTREHPYEGGSDHDIFLGSQIPAILFWCFTDFAYHTSLDRLEHVDPEVTRRLATAITATAFSIADPAVEDLARYRAVLALDRELRVNAAKQAKKSDLVTQWEAWFEGAEQWLTQWIAPTN